MNIENNQRFSGSDFQLVEAVLLGTGAGKADPTRFQPSNLIWIDGEPVAVDCGNGSVLRMKQAGAPACEIKTLFITHLHYDHYSDYPSFIIEPLIGNAAFDRGHPVVFGPPGAKRLVSNFIQTYDIEIDSYAGLQGYEKVRELMHANVLEIHEGWARKFTDCSVKATMVDHGIVMLPCFAYRFDFGGKSIVFSGDTVPNENLIQLARGTDVLVHECTLPDSEVETRRRLGIAWRIHSTPRQVGEVAKKAGVKKLVLNHFAGWNAFSPGKERYEWEKIAPPLVAENFDGEIIVGEDLMKIEF
jgi:ribonuclease Z